MMIKNFRNCLFAHTILHTFATCSREYIFS